MAPGIASSVLAVSYLESVDFLALNFRIRNSKNLLKSADERVVITQVIVTPTEKRETIIFQNVLS